VEATKDAINFTHCLVLVEDLKHVVQDGYDHTGLQACVGHIVAFMGAHYGRPIPCQLLLPVLDQCLTYAQQIPRFAVLIRLISEDC